MPPVPTDPRTTGATPTRSYVTTFDTDEALLSQDGMWLNGKADAIDWTDVYVQAGAAIGAYARNSVAEHRAEQGNLDGVAAEAVGDYDDPTAVLTGEWGPDQYAKAEVFSRNATDDYFQEVQLRVRHVLKPGAITGYEFIFRTSKTEKAYAEIVRWDGAIGTWKSLSRAEGSRYGVQDGDIVEATIIGSKLTAYINGVEVLTAEDDTYSAGAPGIGFNFGCGDTNVDHGFRSFEVHTFG